jgi:hypothetical protein
MAEDQARDIESLQGVRHTTITITIIIIIIITITITTDRDYECRWLPCHCAV